MEEFAGARGNWHEQIFFTEGVIRKLHQPCGRVEVSIGRQNSNLTEVKNQMARKASRQAANVIQNFRYGQRANRWWQLSFGDTENWYGAGDAVAVQG